MRVIMRSWIRGRLRPSSGGAPCFAALLLPPTRLSVVGEYAIAATTAGIAEVRLPLERDEFGTGQHARRRPAGVLRPRLRRAGDLEEGAAGSPDWGRAVRHPEERTRPAAQAGGRRKGERARVGWTAGGRKTQ